MILSIRRNTDTKDTDMTELIPRLAHEAAEDRWPFRVDQWSMRAKRDPEFVFLALEYDQDIPKAPAVYGTLHAALESFAASGHNDRWTDAAQIIAAPWYQETGHFVGAEIEPGTLWWPLDAYGGRICAPEFGHDHPYILKTRINL